MSTLPAIVSPPSAFPGLAQLLQTHGEARKGHLHGTHRIVAPDVTVERWRPHLATFGITRLADVTDLDVIGVPVVQAVRPNAKALSVSQGKGITLAAATASALMECAELWHAENHELVLRRASWAQLAEHAEVVDIDRISFRQGTSLDPHQSMLWVQSLDLMSGRRVWIPHNLVGMDLTSPRDPMNDLFAASTNGLASGNTIVEATAHGLYEVIERDSYRLGVLRGRFTSTAPRIAAHSIRDPSLRQLLNACHGNGVCAALFDMTSDIGVPAVLCLAADQPPNPFRRLAASLGMGCHPSATIAASRAITEAIQCRLTLIAGSRDDLTTDDYVAKRWSREADQLRELIAATPGAISLDELPSYAGETIGGDLQRTLERLRADGIAEVLVVDLSIKRIGMPVVKVIAPGLEEMEMHAKPGRRAQAVLAR